jgi:RNA polymerase sigma factor (sigma-70 family)
MWPFVLTVTYRRLRGHREAAEDVAQETFKALVRADPFAKLRDADALRAYMWRIADNSARSYLESVRRQAEESGLEWLEESASGQPTPEESLGTHEEVVQSLSKLAPVDRELVMMIAEGYSLREAAEATGLSHSNAGVRLHRLRSRLRQSGKE